MGIQGADSFDQSLARGTAVAVLGMKRLRDPASDPPEVTDAASQRPSVRVLVVQNHRLLATAIAKVLGDEADMTVCGIARTGADAALVAAQERPDVALIDFRFPDADGPAVAGMVRTGAPDAMIVFHGADDSETALLDAIDAGASAFLTKSASGDQIAEAVRRAAQGDVLIPVALFAKAVARQRSVITETRERERFLAEFTPRELDILHLLAEGLDTAAMGQLLGIAPHTVEWHVRHVIEKLHVHSKLQAVIEAARKGLIEL